MKEAMITIEVMTKKRAYCALRDDYKQKIWRLAKNRAHTVLLVILCGK